MKTKLINTSTTSKSLFVAVAAFAVTASGVHAFGSTEILTKAGLSDDQVVAVQEAQELKASGDVEAAKETLKSAGITKETMSQIREVAKEAKQAVKDAIEAGDYNAFVLAVGDSPLADVVETEADFNQFVEAHELRLEGDRDGAKEILTELGVDTEKFGNKKGHKGERRGLRADARELLTDDQREALQVAHAANDREAVRAIFAEAGIDLPEKGNKGKRVER